MAVPEPVTVDRWIIFGEGSIAKLVNVKTNPHDNEEYEFEFKPTEHMKYKHQIEYEHLNPNSMTMKQTFPKEYCKMIDPSPKATRWIIMCFPDGKPCHELLEMFNKELLLKYMTLKKENKTLRALLLTTQYMSEKIAKFPVEARSNFLKELKQTKEVLGHSDKQIEGQPTQQ